MRKVITERLFIAVVAFVLLALGHLACGGGYSSPTAPGTYGTPTPGAGPTPTPGGGGGY